MKSTFSHDLEHIARLRVVCPDRPGVIAAVASFLHHHGANITALDQHATQPFSGTLCLRLEFQTPHLDMNAEALERAFQDVVATPFAMEWELRYARILQRVAIFASRQPHCLMELLWRYVRGELPCEVTMVVSNHPDHREAVEAFGLPYHYVPVSGDAAQKAEAEARVLALLADRTDLVVLARYMQILSPAFVDRYPHRIINIHHSFLPAFAGADPYQQAYDRGVKLIGATAHYVTAELDAGPIIEQDVTRVSHRMRVPDLRAIGRDLERRVLAAAVLAHLEDRIIVRENKTWVF